MDGRVEEVDADEGEIRGGVLGLLDQLHHVTALVERGDPEALGIRDLLQQDLSGRRIGGRAGRLEGRDERRQILFQQVVPEVHDEVVGAEEVCCDQHAVSQSERRLLGDVRDLRSEVAAVTEGSPDLRARGPRDHADLLDAGGDHRLDAVEQDRLVGDRNELFRSRVGDRAETGALASRQDQRLHRRGIVTGTVSSSSRPRQSIR